MVDRPKSIGQAHRVFSQMEKEIERLTTEGERKDAAILAAYDELMNLQPHIPQACKPGHGGFIDSHVDEAMRVLSSVSDNPAQVRPHTQPIEIEREPVADEQILNCAHCGQPAPSPHISCDTADDRHDS